MFLAPLKPAQKRAFMALATLVLRADGRSSRFEHELMKTLTAEMGMPNTPKDMDLVAAAAEFADWESRVRAILELISIARADCDFDKRESEVIRNIARRFEITDGEFEILDDWVFRQLSLAREAVYLMTKLREE